MRQLVQLFSEVTSTIIHLYSYPNLSPIEIIKPMDHRTKVSDEKDVIKLLRINSYIYGSLLMVEEKRKVTVSDADEDFR